MTWLALFFAFEMGVVPQVGIIAYPEPFEHDVIEWGVLYTQLEMEALLFGHVFLGGSVRTYVLPTEGIDFSPRSSVYDFHAGLRWRMLEAGWRHRCFHPMMPYLPVLDVELHGVEGGYDELYVRIEVER